MNIPPQTGRRAPEHESPFNPWPWGITTACALFAAGMFGFVIVSLFHRVDLVAPDYYEQEIRYQARLDQMNRARSLGGQIRVNYDATGQQIELRLPVDHAGASGRIHLYRPAAARLDRELPLHLDSAGIQRLDAVDLPAGPWWVRLEWKVEDREYCQESRIVIPKAGT
jgi:hypothetical protein